MRRISAIVLTAAGIAALTLTAAGASSASEVSNLTAEPIHASVTSKTTTHSQPLLGAPKTGTLHKGMDVGVWCWVPGQVVNGSDVWLMLDGGLGFGPRASIQADSSVPRCSANGG